MATKTITLDIDAYERLIAAKQEENESFSSVVRRALWPDMPQSGTAILNYLSSRPVKMTEEALNQIEEADQTNASRAEIRDSSF